MFERFTNAARDVVVTAQGEAARMGHGVTGTEHLLLGLLSVPDGVAARVLEDAGLRAEDVREEVLRWDGATRRPPSPADALRAIGIDLDAVRAEVERSFGPGALERPVRTRPPRRRRWQQRRRCVASGPGVPFAPRAKSVLELSLREALALRHGYIGTEHILLGLLREGAGMGARVLVARGVRLDHLRQEVLRALGRVA